MKLTSSEAVILAEFIEMNLLDNIRNDTEIDNMDWLIEMVHVYEKLINFGGDGDE